MADFSSKIRNSLGQYFLALNHGYGFLPFQQNLIAPALEDLENGKLQRLIVLMPPGHAKTELAQHFIAWCLGRDPRRSLMSLSYSYNLAIETGRKVKVLLQSDLHQRVFPNSRMSRDSRAADALTMTAGGKYWAVGFDGTIAGHRPRGIVIDDPHKNMQEARSPAVIQSLMDIYKGVVRPRLPMTGGGFIALLMTRWCRGDMYDRIVDLDGRVEEGGDWQVVKLSALVDGKPLWSSPGTLKRYQAEQRNTEEWNALWQQEPVQSTGPWFKEEWLRYYEGRMAPGKFAAYMICDPGLKQHIHSDPTSLQVWMAGPDKKKFLVDWVLDKMDPSQRTRAIFNLFKVWQPVRFTYEEYGLMADTFHLKLEAESRGVRLYPIPVGRKGPRHMLAKEDRIQELVGDFSNGQIWLPQRLVKRRVDGSELDLIQYFLHQEYLPYAGKHSVSHDEGLDTMSRIHDPELAMQHAEGYRQDSDETEPPVRSAGGWESRF